MKFPVTSHCSNASDAIPLYMLMVRNDINKDSIIFLVLIMYKGSLHFTIIIEPVTYFHNSPVSYKPEIELASLVLISIGARIERVATF